MSRPLVYNLMNSAEVVGSLKQVSFKKLILTDGYNSTWALDL
jgi:hypothetical protein